MPTGFETINEVLSRVRRARNVATALRLAGQAEAASPGELYWPDLIQTVESILPTTDEMSEAIAAVHQRDCNKRP